MIARHLPGSFQFHVFTEHTRSVPAHMIKHALEPWPDVGGRRGAWWYKLQLFDPQHRLNQVLYLDLDTVIVSDLSWIYDLDRDYFWTLLDFKYLWRPAWQGINSSLMYVNPRKALNIWAPFENYSVQDIRRQFVGDQDYLNHIIDRNRLRFIDNIKAQSWRWQVHDGGMDQVSRGYRSPGQGSVLDPATSLVVFHGAPKPHQVQDPQIAQHWRC